MVKPRQWQPMFNGMLGLKQGYAITNMPPGSCLNIKNMYLNGLGGKVSRRGYVELFHTVEKRLYCGAITGAVLPQSIIVQAVTGATAMVHEVGTGYVVVESVTGTFNSTNVVTGTNPNGTTYTFTPTATLIVADNRLTNRVRSVIQYNPYGGTSEALAYAGTKIFKQNGLLSTVVRGSVSNDIPWELVQYRDRVLGVNGADTSFLYDTNGYVKISITPPAAHATATVGAGGTLPDGDHYYLVTFYDSTRGRESNPYDVGSAPYATANAGAGNSTITLSALPAFTAGEGVTHRRIYRRSPSETVFSRIGEITIATATFVDNGIATTSLTLEYDTGAHDTGNTPHPNSSLIAEQFDRIFMVDPTDPSILVYSKIGNYWAFPSANFFYVGRGDGSRIKRIEKHGKALLIHKGNGWYILDEDPASSTASVKFLSKIGTQDFRTSVSAHNQVVRLTTTGFYRSVPTEYSTTDIREDYIGSDVSEYESALDYANSNLACMFNYNAYNRRHVYYVEPVPASFYSKCLVFDIVLTQWMYYEIGTDVYCVNDYTLNNARYMMFGDGYGIVWRWDVGDGDGSNAAAATLKGTATSAAAASLTDSTKTWPVDGLVGCVIQTISGTGAGQRRRILSNTATSVTVAAWATNPDATTTYSIAGIDKYADEYWDSNGDPHIWKRMRWAVPYIKQNGTYDIEISFFKDFALSANVTKTLSLSTVGVWGSFLWGTGVWGGAATALTRLRLNGKYHYYCIRYRNQYAGEPFNWDGHGVVFQVLYDRNK